MHMRGNVKLSIKTVYVKYAKTYQTKVQIAHFISQYSTVVFVNRDGQDHNTRLALRKYRTSHEVWSLQNAGDIQKMEQTFENYAIIILIYIRKNIAILALMPIHNESSTKRIMCCAYLHSPKLTAIAEQETYLN